MMTGVHLARAWFVGLGITFLVLLARRRIVTDVNYSLPYFYLSEEYFLAQLHLSDVDVVLKLIWNHRKLTSHLNYCVQDHVD